MKFSYNISLVLLLSSVLFSCTERIEIKTKAGDTKLSIFGYITNDTTQHSVKITRSAPYFSTDTQQTISNAIVTISDGDIVFSLTESTENPGLYLTEENVYATEGKTYTLDILLDFNDDGRNEHYRAVSTMPYATQVDSIVLRPSKELSFLPELLLYGRLPENQTNRLALYVTKNKFPETIFDYFMIIPDWYFKGYEIDGYELPFMVEDGILAGDTILFRVSSFGRDFSSFISQARSEAGGKNPIFSGPPADVKTNITALDPENKTGIVGTFGAFPISETYTISDKDYLFPGQQ